METYILKIMQCSSIFILFYYLILRQQKAGNLKRFYLLATVILSFVIPFITIKNTLPMHENGLQIGDLISQNVSVVKASDKAINWLQGIWIFGSTIFLVRFIFSVKSLFTKIYSSQRIKHSTYTIVLTTENVTPHSFWKYIFLNKDAYLNNDIDPAILIHEKAHLDQKHSLDLLFIELLIAIFWFNPAFYFYKKEMLIIHESLADDAVLQTTNSFENYSKILLNHLTKTPLPLCNPFNFNNTKNRFIMMTKKPNGKTRLAAIATVPLICAVTFVYANRVIVEKTNPQRHVVQENPKPPKVKKEIFPATKEPVADIAPTREIQQDLPKSIEKIQAIVDTTKLPLKDQQIAKAETSDKIDAEFPGGSEAFRQKYMENFDNTRIEQKKVA